MPLCSSCFSLVDVSILKILPASSGISSRKVLVHIEILWYLYLRIKSDGYRTTTIIHSPTPPWPVMEVLGGTLVGSSKRWSKLLSLFAFVA